MDDYKILEVDVSKLPDQSVEVPIKCEPKVKCKNKFIQKYLIKMFGYKIIYETKQAKIITIKAEDCPKDWNGELTFKLEDNN